MALNSVNTNNGALIALQNLNATNNELANVQGRINTGKKVSSAKDNGAIWAIAQNQRAEIGALNSAATSRQNLLAAHAVLRLHKRLRLISRPPTHRSFRPAYSVRS